MWKNKMSDIDWRAVAADRNVFEVTVEGASSPEENIFVTYGGKQENFHEEET